jgi:Na+:H+ antiporter, NhaA family
LGAAKNMISKIWHRFVAMESASALVLVGAAALALGWSNSPWPASYAAWLAWPGAGWGSLMVWINDGLMAIFFLVVGLEIKREMLVGELARWRQAVLPLGGALGGMLVPTLIYVVINRDSAQGLRGWAIPSATDIAFALGVLMLLGSRVPSTLKVFLTAVAIIDDLGAITIIALFYTRQLAWDMLGWGALVCALLFALNRWRVQRAWPYAFAGVLLWWCVLHSGVHATLAGVAVALAIPAHADAPQVSLLERMEEGLHPWVAYGVLPLFALANAGLSMQGLQWHSLLAPVPLGIVCGLVLGKAIGVFGASTLLVVSGFAMWPHGANRWQFFGVCILCGIGFTMSLLIGGLAFAGPLQAEYAAQVKLGVLAASVAAAGLGAAVLWAAGRQRVRGS